MIAALICFFCVFFGIICYCLPNRRKQGALAFFFLISDGFGFLSVGSYGSFPVNKTSDYAILLLAAIISLYFYKGKNIFSPSNKIFKLFYILVGYLTINFACTILLGWETTTFALQTWRNYLLFLSFIPLQALNEKDLDWLFKRIVFITMFTTVLFILQPITHIQFLAGDTMASISSDNAWSMRYRNIPYLTYFCLIYCSVFIRLDKIKEPILLLVCLSALIITQHRGIMLGYVICIVLYLLYRRKATQIVSYSIIGSIVFFIAGDFVLQRFDQGNTSDDIDSLLKFDIKKMGANYDPRTEGTMTFRVALLLERGEYLLEHPKFLLTGVGMRHEESPLTPRSFSFALGSAYYKDGRWVPQQLNSGDLVWMEPFFKFGLLGLFLYIFITLSWIKEYYHHGKDTPLATSAMFFYLLLIIISFKNDILFNKTCLFFNYLTLMIVCKDYKQNRLENII